MALVLMLNASFEPMRAITTARAVMRVHEGRANLIESTGNVLRSPSITMEEPAVIQLRTFVRVPPPQQPTWSRQGTLMRDRFRCTFCPGRADTIDHVHPQSRGGEDSWWNCVASCGPCNNAKGSMSVEAFCGGLPFKPGLPPASMVPFLWMSATPSRWVPYVEPWWRRKTQVPMRTDGARARAGRQGVLVVPRA